LRFALAGVAACLTAGSISSPAAAQENFAGQWLIAGAVAGPWAGDPKDPGDEADARRLLGKRLAIDAKFFRAPKPLGCAKPAYVFGDATADTLFEGSLNADGANKPTDPVVVARSLGVTHKTVRGMTASCSEVEFFLIDPDTILFGLNNRVFTMKRAK
jgi:hypothetical protein